MYIAPRYHFVITVTLLVPLTFCKNVFFTHCVIPITLCNNFLSDFVTIILKFVKVPLLVKLCDKFSPKDPKKVCEIFFSHFLIKTVTVHSFQSCQKSREPLLIDDKTIT